MAYASVNTYISNKECPACRSYDYSMNLLAPSCSVKFGTDDGGMQLCVSCEVCGQYKITDHALRKVEADRTNGLRAKLAAWLYHKKKDTKEILIDSGANANAYFIDKVLSEVILTDTEDVKYALLIWFIKELKERGGVHEKIAASEIRINFIAPEIIAHRDSIVWAIENALTEEGWINKKLDPPLNKYNYSVTSKGLDIYKNRQKEIELGTIIPPELGTPWLFLCHASEDKTQVEEMYHQLKAAGLKPWLDKEDLLPGQNWAEEIPTIIRDSNFILIFFSTTSVAKRGYVQKEFKLALDVLDETPEGKISVIPVRLDSCKIPSRFSNLHYVDLFENGGFEKILKSVKKEMSSFETKPTQKKSPEQTIDVNKQLEAYTQAYALCRQLLKNLHKPELWQTVIDCQNWWDSGRALLMRKKPQDAFFKTFKGCMMFGELSNKIEDERKEKMEIFNQLQTTLGILEKESSNLTG